MATKVLLSQPLLMNVKHLKNKQLKNSRPKNLRKLANFTSEVLVVLPSSKIMVMNKTSTFKCAGKMPQSATIN